MLVWRKGSINKNCICATVVCTIIMVHNGMSSSTDRSIVSGFDLAWFSSLSSKYRTSVSSVFMVLCRYLILFAYIYFFTF